jgi:death-on-curing protein
MIQFDFLSTQEVLELHEYIIDRYGGTLGLRELSLLDSAVAQPSLFVFGSCLHTDVFQMAAAYAFHIIKNHAFIDGNKRTGLLTALTFLRRNKIIIEADLDSLYDLTIDIATSKVNKGQIAEFFEKHHEKIGQN